MKTQILAATFSDLAPGNRNGATARPTRIASRTTASQRRADDEHADEQAADAIAQRLDHLAVLDPGTDQEADSGAIEGGGQRREHDQADDDGEQPVLLDRDLADQEGAAQRGRPRQRDLV